MAMKIRKEIRLDGYTQELLDNLKNSGKYGSEGSIIRLAVQEFARTQKSNAPTGT